MLSLERFADAHIHIEDNDYEKIESMLEYITTLGVTDGAILALENYPPCDRAQTFSTLYFKEKFKDIKLRAFGSLYEFDVYADIPFDVQLQRLIDLGCDGIKLMNMKPDVHKALGRGINDPIYEPLFAMLEETGFPIVLHAADPEEFWISPDYMTPGAVAAGWCYADGTYPTYQQIYDEVFEVLDRHPCLNIVIAHFFFLSNNIEEAKRVLEKYKNLKLDLTPGHEMYMGFSKDIEAWHDFFVKYQDRILFGTDSTTTRSNDITYKKYSLVVQGIEHDSTEFPIPRHPEILVRGLYLDRDIIEKIAYKNFIDFVGDSPRPVNMEYARTEAQKLLSESKKFDGLEKTVESLSEFLEKTE